MDNLTNPAICITHRKFNNVPCVVSIFLPPVNAIPVAFLSITCNENTFCQDLTPQLLSKENIKRRDVSLMAPFDEVFLDELAQIGALRTATTPVQTTVDPYLLSLINIVMDGHDETLQRAAP